MIKRILLCAALGLLLPGCAYFNTFYNTKRLYKEAQKEYKRRTTDKPSPSEVQNLDKIIEKASKILVVHPSSKYVDDALLIIGECYYYKQEYLKGVRKFDELATIFPNSGLVPRAQLWKAQCYIELKDYGSAESTLLELQQRRKKGDIFHESQYYLGELNFRKEKYEVAAQLFGESARKLSDEKLKAEALMRLGESHFQLGQFEQSAEAYKQASKKNVDRERKFEATLSYARALKASQKYDQALRRLNTMLSEFTTYKDLPWVKFEIADCHRLNGKVKDAEFEFMGVTADHQRTEASAASHFALGKLYLERDHDYDKAKQHFDKVRTESPISQYVTEAQELSEAISNYRELNNSFVVMTMQQEALADGGTQAQLSAIQKNSDQNGEGKRKRASIRRLPTKSLEFSNDPAKLENDLALNKIALAEIYQSFLEMPDSAAYYYNEVIRDYSHTPAATHAMYALAFLWRDGDAEQQAQSDRLLHDLADQYPDAPHGIAARRLLGMPVAEVSAANLNNDKFHQAEELWLVQDKPRQAIALYQELLQEEPKADTSPKSLFAIGWIYENELDDNQQAYTTYKQLLEEYPNSDYAKHVLKKVTIYEQQIKKQEQEAQQQVAVESGEDSTASEGNDVRSRIHEDRQDVQLTKQDEPAGETAQPPLDDSLDAARKKDDPRRSGARFQQPSRQTPQQDTPSAPDEEEAPQNPPPDEDEEPQVPPP